MVYKKVRLKNFKCFNEADFEFSKITLLTGANSSGKSSIIHGLLAPLQSGEFPFQFSPNGNYVNLGDYENIVNRHVKSKEMEISYDFSRSDNGMPTSLKTSWVNNPIRNLPKLKSLYVKGEFFEVSIKRLKKKYKLEFSYNENADKGVLAKDIETQKRFTSILSTLIEKDPKNERKENKGFTSILDKKIAMNKAKEVIQFDNIDTFRTELYEKTSFAFDIFLQRLKNFINTLQGKINYISSFRFNPQKSRFEVTKTDLKVGKNGENFEDQIVYWETKSSKEFNELVEILKDLKLSRKLKTKRLKGGNYELNFKPHIKGVYSSITDIGFGMSQFLPIIIADLQLPNGSTLIVSQPEIHLHPSVQSDFGNYLAKQIKDKKKNYIIETHSEYLINKIRLLIIKGVLKEEDVSVYFLQNNGNNVMNHKLKFTKSGKIENAPKEFFDTYMIDVMDIALSI